MGIKKQRKGNRKGKSAFSLGVIGLLLALLVYGLTLPVAAAGESGREPREQERGSADADTSHSDKSAFAGNEEYQAMLKALPDDVAALLPEALYSSDIDKVAQGASETLDFGYWIRTIGRAIGLKVGDALRLLATLLGILVLAAVLNAVKASFASPSMGNVFSLCSSAAVFLLAVSSLYGILQSVSTFFQNLCLFANALIPMMGTLYAMGGNVSSAVVSHSALMLFMTLTENFCARSVIPVSGMCMAFSAAGILAPEMNLGGLSGFFKKLYTTALTFLMSAFCTVMAAQSLLASKADNLTGKAAKFAVGNLIPVVGSSLAGTMGTVGYSIEYIRASVGVVGVVGILLALVPTLTTLLVTKLALSLATGAAEALGCVQEGKIVAELSGINGFLLAAACICSVTLIFMLALFTKCSSAVGI